MSKSKRHHFLPQFYLKNFGDPLYSDNINVYFFDDGCWSNQPITPKGVGWMPHLYSIADENGKSLDVFERDFFSKLDNELAEPMRKAATVKGAKELSKQERHSVARFISYLFSRNPQVIEEIRKGYANPTASQKIHYSTDDQKHAATLQSDGKDRSGQMHFNQFILTGIQERAEKRANYLSELKWKFQYTGEQGPFITSDLPIFRYQKQGVEFYSCPLSSTVAVVMTSGGKFTQREYYGTNAFVVFKNNQTMESANDFVVCRQKNFPGFSQMPHWLKKKRPS